MSTLILLTSCNSKESNNIQYKNNGSYIDIEQYTEAINLIINNSNATDENIDNISDLTSASVKNNILNKVYNSGSDFEINNYYIFNGCIMVQASNSNTDLMYKLHVEKDIITECVIYELYY